MKLQPTHVAVVTGAASGIGLAITEALVQHGVRVMLSDINAEALAQAVTALQLQGGDVRGFVADVSNADAVQALADATLTHFGSLNIAVNNAGVVNRGYAWELSLPEWQRVLNTNLWGVIHGVRSFVPAILATGEPGYVVNVASMASVSVVDRLAPYTVAKHGVLGLSDVLRADFVHADAPVGVSVVMPGRVATGMNPIGVLPASAVAANVVDAIHHDRPYVFTDQESAGAVQRRFAAIVDARSQVIASEGASD